MKTELKYFVRENTWLIRGMIDFGWGNGYVALPEGHPCFGLDYTDIHEKYDIEVNGGLTFACHSDSLKDGAFENFPEGNWWVVGFDTAHSWDSIAMWPTKESVEFETKRLVSQLEAITVPATQS
jgi:hypothetical protein